MGLAFLIYTVYNLIDRFGASIDFILESSPHPPPDKRHMVKLIGRRLIVMLGMPIALTVSLGISQWIRKDSWFHLLTDIDVVGSFLAIPIAWLTTIVALFLIYYFVPRTPVPAKQAFKVALIIGPLVEMFRFGIGIYNGYAVSVHKIYGVFAVIPMLILWVFLTWMLLLVGGMMIRFDKGTATKKPKQSTGG